MKKKSFIQILLFVGLVLFIAILLGSYYYRNSQINSFKASAPLTTDETVNWKTYTDKTYSYSVKYPNGWFVSSSKKGVVDIANFTEQKLTYQEKKNIIGGLDTSKISITLGVYDGTISSGTSLVDWLKTNGQYISAMSGAPTSVKQTTIAGNSGLILNYEGTGLFYIFSAKSHVYYVYFKPDTSKFAGVFNQILSTFKFVN